ncbi:unnamed protein product [Ilex paraguariensis]|uniref:Chlororespiratory reduction 4 n=1 Tax=Ilex paraguariensis TaxID=185542 RepID=A0ABC8R6L7_9AQUA
MIKAITNFNHFSVPRLATEPIKLTHIVDNLKKCSSLRELESVYASMTKTNANQDCFLMNQFITTCSAFERTDYSILAFTQMKDPNVFVYNAMIRGFVHCFYPLKALRFYLGMLRSQIRPTSYTFSSMVKACALVCAVGFGETVHGQIWKIGFRSHVFVETTLVDFYSTLGRIDESKQVFDEMPERDVFVWTTMISAHARVGDMGCAWGLFDEMPERNTATWNTMIDGYARLGYVEAAEHLFNEMPITDLISWTTMITCYVQNKQYTEGLAVFNEMKANGVKPDEVTMSTVISVCAHIGVLDLGKETHLYVMHNGFDLDVYIVSAFIDMYAKCGSMDKSLMVFLKLWDKNLFCWNSVIEGLAVHGACTHAGLVDEGRGRFLNMTLDYSIAPEIEHYGFMADLFCKAGLLEDALELIGNMRMEPNSVIWGALLGGCKLHKNLEIDQVAMDNLVVLEPNNSGYHTLLVNMYAEANRWSEVAKLRATLKVAKLRATLKVLGVEKASLGSSWIEMGRKIHQFAASDRYHPTSVEIYSLMNELDGQLKLTGYVTELFHSDLFMKNGDDIQR